jgi:murein DD-endopeptidase MepM/ murein hydrolase activator NlpD
VRVIAAALVAVIVGSPALRRVATAAQRPVASDGASVSRDEAGARPAAFRTHVVQVGETVAGVAAGAGLSDASVYMNNPALRPGVAPAAGALLRLPRRDGLLYNVWAGDSVATIAARFGVAPSAIEREPSNVILWPNVVLPGQLLLVPGATVMPPAARPSTATTAAQLPGVRPPAAVRPAALSEPWAWPIAGPLSSYFGPSHPLGIDIDLYGRAGAPIGAAHSGVVTFAGGDPCCSYGYYVDIDHGDGWLTRYGHLIAPPPVRAGQAVAQGTVIGYAGTTGDSTGVHLHFEIRHEGTPLNPLVLLPASPKGATRSQ